MVSSGDLQIDRQHEELAQTMLEAGLQQSERRPVDKQNLQDLSSNSIAISHASEASIDQRAQAIMEEAERQLARQEKSNDDEDIPRGSTAAKVQSVADRAAERARGNKPLAAEKLREHIAEQA